MRREFRLCPIENTYNTAMENEVTKERAKFNDTIIAL